MENYLIDNYSLDSLHFSKPKKHSEYYYSKIKYSLDKDLVNFNIQLPIMGITNINDKNVSLEFINNNISEYSKKCYNFLTNLEGIIIDNIYLNVTEWFGKEIPKESVKKMYNSFLKAPKNSESNVGMTININKSKICHLKYLVFSKDTVFLVWELLSCKVYKKINKVKQYGFIEDPEDYSLEDPEETDLPELNEESLEKNNTFF